MKCTFCGQKIDDNSKYCPICGYLYKVDSIPKNKVESNLVNNNPNKKVTIILTIFIVLVTVFAILGLRKLFNDRADEGIANKNSEISITSDIVKNVSKIYDNEVFAKYLIDLGNEGINSVTSNNISDKDKIFIAYQNVERDLINETKANDSVLNDYSLSSCFGNCFEVTSGENIKSVSVDDVKESIMIMFGEEVADNFDFKIDYESEKALYNLNDNSYDEYLISSQEQSIDYSINNIDAYKEANSLVINQEWVVNDLSIKVKQIFKLENDNYYWSSCELSN